MATCKNRYEEFTKWHYDNKVILMIDAEESWIQDTMDHLSKQDDGEIQQESLHLEFTNSNATELED